jgi:hypothetical protein
MVIRPSIFRLAFVASAMLGVVVSASAVSQAESKRRETRKPVLTNPKFDPAAERVGLFEGMNDGRLESKFIPRDSTGGFVLVSNNSDQPLTVELPEAFVAVQVLKQFGGGGLGGGGLGGGGLGGGGLGGGQGGGQGGGNQQAGGGFGGGGQGGGLGGGGLGGGGQGGGGGFFSIPPEKSVKVPYISACLNHGKPDPNPRVEYKLVPVEEYTQDPVLAELIRLVGTGRVDQHSAQAAIWTRTDNMSWQQLAAKSHRNLSGVVEYYFSSANIAEAQLLAARAEGIAKESKGKRNEAAAEVVEPRVR